MVALVQWQWYSINTHQKSIFLKSGSMVTGSSKIWVGVDNKPRELSDSSQYIRRILSTTTTDGTLVSVKLIPENILPPASFGIDSTIVVTISDVMANAYITIDLTYSNFKSIYRLSFNSIYSPGTYTFKLSHILDSLGPVNTENDTYYDSDDNGSGEHPRAPVMWYTRDSVSTQTYVSGSVATCGMEFNKCTYVNSHTTIVAYT